MVYFSFETVRKQLKRKKSWEKEEVGFVEMRISSFFASFPPFSQVVLLLRWFVGTRSPGLPCCSHKSRSVEGRSPLGQRKNYINGEKVFSRKRRLINFLLLCVCSWLKFENQFEATATSCRFSRAFETYFLSFFERVDMLILSFSQTRTHKKVFGMYLAEGAR